MNKKKKNYSFTYLLPCIFENVNINKKVLEGFINTYMFTNKTIDLGKIFIECKFNYLNSNFNI